MSVLGKTKKTKAKENNSNYFMLIERWEDMLEFLKYIKMSNQLPYKLYATQTMFA